jgi:hypothetical protein
MIDYILECFGRCGDCDAEYDPEDAENNCECGGYITLVECYEGCRYCDEG